MTGFVSPLTESVVRKRAAGFCEWIDSTWQYEDVTRCKNDLHLRCLKTDVNKDNAGVKLLCTPHYDHVLALKASRKKKKKPKNEQKEQKNLFG